MSIIKLNNALNKINNKKSMIREEEIISQVMDYLLQTGPLGE